MKPQTVVWGTFCLTHLNHWSQCRLFIVIMWLMKSWWLPVGLSEEWLMDQGVILVKLGRKIWATKGKAWYSLHLWPISRRYCLPCHWGLWLTRACLPSQVKVLLQTQWQVHESPVLPSGTLNGCYLWIKRAEPLSTMENLWKAVPYVKHDVMERVSEPRLYFLYGHH